MAKNYIIGKARRTKRILVLCVVFAVLTAVAVSALQDGLTVRHYDIETDNLREGQRIRIVVITDLHSLYYGENQQHLIETIKQQKLDIIALVGDIVDDDRSEDGAVAFFEGIRNLAPTYYVIGNHEVWTGEVVRIKKMVAGYGIVVLTNESTTLSINGAKICISGIDDPEMYEDSYHALKRTYNADEKMLSGFSQLDERQFNVLLAHRPERFESYQNYNFDLVLSGHAHGGQVRIPGILNGLIAPNQGLFPKYAGGVYTQDKQTMLVSRGLGKYAQVPRIYNPPEVVVVDILGSKMR